MATKRNQVTTYVDGDTYKWILAGARQRRGSVSQFLAALLANAAQPKPTPPAVSGSAWENRPAPLLRPAEPARPQVPEPDQTYDPAKCQSLYDSFCAKGMSREDAIAKARRCVSWSKDWEPIDEETDDESVA